MTYPASCPFCQSTRFRCEGSMDAANCPRMYQDESDCGLYQVEDGWIETVTGTRFHFTDPALDEIRLDDICHALGRINRFMGHTRNFYSVAEHSVLMASRAIDLGHTDREVLTILLHDAAEAYIGDLPRPVKAKVPQFKTVEKAIDTAVARKYGLIYPFPAWLKEYDTRILVDERLYCMNPSGNDWGTDNLEPLGITPKFWAPEDATSRLRNSIDGMFERLGQRGMI